MPDTPDRATPTPAETSTPDAAARAAAADAYRRSEEERSERHMWWYLAYFLFGIHIVAFVMIYAVTHAK
ncbi:hypothetical protein DY218_30865 [Streptomyces triticagri]|uniref:Uncharacterized protein n=1 Tax=Streptomyces triticagri TaxID=2293568 RepID=A0A372LVZ1_9ACTN|nr:hypothetical protein [Streptomyces triticagri]RFU82821.1 hypothetical protein DY218_30865 [Streptomyces triticagri]